MTASVAVIGAGPGGLVAARWLSAQGFRVTIFESASELGGQWTGMSGHSGVWPDMHTNSSRILTAFSDLPHHAAAFPSNRDVLDYLRRYAEMFDLIPHTRFDTTVTRLRRHDRFGWVIDNASGSECFDRVVIASGRFQTPAIPSIPGLETFDGSESAISTYDFRGANRYRGKRVLIAGCAVSALEIASELARAGAHVVVTQRRQRYVLPKFDAGVPSDHRIFTRYGTLAAESLPAAEIDRQLKEIVVEAGGSPEQYGAPAPDSSLFAAGVTLSQDYLPLVAEGRIEIRPWLESVDGDAVTFSDGRRENFDGILFGTGFRLHLPFLDESIRAVVDLDDIQLDADLHTFHPSLPGLAFLGLWDQSGGYFVPLELQARWLAYTWAGAIPGHEPQAQRASIAAYRQRRGLPQKTRMNLVALAFARAAGVEPSLGRWPQLHRALLFGPLAPSCFRLEGSDALPDAASRFAADAAAFGAITDNQLTARERRYWAMVESTGG